MKKVFYSVFLVILGLIPEVRGQQLQISNLNAYPIDFNEERIPIELDVNFKIQDPDVLDHFQVTLAQDAQKSNAVEMIVARDHWHLWTRDDLKLVTSRVKIPESLVGNCHYVEVKAFDEGGTEVTLTGYSF